MYILDFIDIIVLLVSPHLLENTIPDVHIQDCPVKNGPIDHQCKQFMTYSNVSLVGDL